MLPKVVTVEEVVSSPMVADPLHRLDCCVISDGGGALVGIITDGDLRRHMAAGTNIRSRIASDIMTRRPVTVSSHTLAAEALHILEQRKITSIVVVDSANLVQGVVHLHHLWRTGMV